MIGLARTAQLAGWALTGFKFRSENEFDTQFGYVRPTSLSLPAANGWVGPNNDGSNYWQNFTFDNTNIGDGYYSAVATTCRFPRAENVNFTEEFGDYYVNQLTEPDVTYYAPAYTIVEYDPNLGEDRPQILTLHTKLGASDDSNDPFFTFNPDFGGFDWIETNTRWNTLADRWITILMCIGEQKTDFAGWDGFEEDFWFETNYGRLAFIDTYSGELIDTFDFAYEPFITDFRSTFSDFTFKYIRGSQASGEDLYTSEGFDGALDIQIRDLSQNQNIENPGEFKTAAHWAAAGNSFDPLANFNGVPIWKYFIGPYFPGEVAGVKAWSNIVVTDEDTAETGFVKLESLRECRIQPTVAGEREWLRNNDSQLTAPFTTFPIPAPEDGLLAYYDTRFDAGYTGSGTNLIDISGNGNDATINGAFSYDNKSITLLNTSTDSDENDSHLQLPNLENIKTILMRFKVEDVVAPGIGRYLLDARLGLSAGWIAKLSTQSPPYAGSGWDNALMSINGQNKEAFDFDTMESPALDDYITFALINDGSFSDDLTLFARHTGDREGHYATVRSIFVYDRELSQTEIQNIHKAIK